MGRKVTLKEVLSAVKLSLLVVWCWPLPQDASRFKILCMKVHHCLCIIMEISIVIPIIYAITNHLDDPEFCVHILIVTCGLIHTSSCFFFYMVNHHHIQNVTFEIVHFSGSMKPHEEIVIQRYIDKCVGFHGGSLIIYYFGGLLPVVMPFVITELSLPLLNEYPFDVSYQPLKTILQIKQSIAVITVSGQLCTNVFMALLLWFVTARFEMFIEDLGKVTNAYQLFECIKRHQEVLKYAEEVIIVVRPFAFTTVCCSSICLICVFLFLLTNQPIRTILHFVSLALTTISEVYMYSWSAEYLMYTSKSVAEAAFGLLENNNFIELWKCLQIIIMRSQKSIEITVPCLMPALSLNYFTTYLSTGLSYFTTLRVMMMDNE